MLTMLTAVSVSAEHTAGKTLHPSVKCHQGIPDTNRTDCSQLTPPLTTIPTPNHEFTEELNLEGNRIDSLKKEQFKHLRYHYLKKLILTSNSMGVIEDYTFIGLGKLEDLSLEYNQINQLSRYTFVGLENLQFLSLMENNIATITNGTFEVLGKLQKLDLDACGIQRIEVGAFKGLANLQQLILRTNNLDNFPDQCLVHLPVLTYLSLDNNPLMEVPQQICTHLSYLTKFELSTHEVKTLEFGKDFQLCKNLDFLAIDVAGQLGHQQQWKIIDENTFKYFNKPLRNLELYYRHVNVCGSPFVPFQRIDSVELKRGDMYDYNTDKLSVAELRQLLYAFEGVKILNLGLFQLSGHTLDFDSTTLQGLESVSLEELKIYQTKLTLEDFTFQWLKFLRTLSLTSVYLTTIPDRVFYNLTGLEELDLRGNKLTAIPRTALSILTNLKMLNLAGNMIHRVTADMLLGLHNVVTFNLYSNKIHMDSLHMAAFADLQNLQSLIFSHVDAMYVDVSNVKPLKNITTFDFSYSPKIGRMMYKYLREFRTMYPKLTFLDLSGTRLNKFPGKPQSFTVPNVRTLKLNALHLDSQTLECFLFHCFPKLENLELNNNKLNKIDEGCFSNTTMLVHLDLSYNQLATLNNNIWNGLQNLTTLDLSYNAIQIVNSTTFHGLLQLQNLYLGGNPFTCTCDVVWFHTWLLTNPEMLIFQKHLHPQERHWLQNYQCFSPNEYSDTYLVDFDTDILECESNIIMTVSVILITLATVFTLAGVIWKKFRWSIKYKYFLWKLRMGLIKNGYQVVDGANQANNYKYDVMASYADEDFLWVRREMMPRLEERDGFKLCIKDREYVPGVVKATNIDVCVHDSNHIVFVLTEDFINDQICIFELEVAFHRLFDELKDVIILVQLKPIPEHKLPRLIRLLKCRKKCIEWTEDEAGKELFWTKLKTEIEKDNRVNNRTRLNLLQMA
ncbi:uncharacterized protein LOC144446810 [Glandiceps talaboti]